MNQRENLLAIFRREPFEWLPAEFNLCPSLEEEYKRRTGSHLPYQEYFEMPWRNAPDIQIPFDKNRYLPYYPDLKPGSTIDLWGVAHEPGSEAAKHMTYLRSPLRGIDSLQEIMAYPLPDFRGGDASSQKASVEAIHARGLAACGNMQTTIWETAWYIRGMEDLMMDMMSEDPIAEYILDAVTEQSVCRAVSYARAGADFLFLGDDIGMQRTPMMSTELYCQWLKPRLARVIRAAREVNPNILIAYHSCGHATPFLPHLIEAGVDILNPVQPESMDFREIYREFGGKLSFHGTIGTQSTMPFGTPEEVKAKVREHMEIASSFGGLLPAPTHLLEPAVPWENILAYVQACREYPVKK